MHRSITDPDARLTHKSNGQASMPAYAGHVLMENRNGLVAYSCLTHAAGTAKRDAALVLVDWLGPRRRRITLGADKGCDVLGFVHALRQRRVTPHVATDRRVSKLGVVRRSGVDGCTTRHPGYAVNEQVVDIVGEGFDAGIRRGDLVDADMVSHRISPDIRMLAFASPAYLAAQPAIGMPWQLREHNCTRICSIGNGGVPPWRFGTATSTVDIKVGGSVAVDTTTLALAAALDGTGIAYLGSDYLAPYLQSGQFLPVLEEWAINRPGFHLRYSGRRHVPQPLVTLARFLKARAD